MITGVGQTGGRLQGIGVKFPLLIRVALQTQLIDIDIGGLQLALNGYPGYPGYLVGSRGLMRLMTIQALEGAVAGLYRMSMGLGKLGLDILCRTADPMAVITETWLIGLRQYLLIVRPMTLGMTIQTTGQPGGLVTGSQPAQLYVGWIMVIRGEGRGMITVVTAETEALRRGCRTIVEVRSSSLLILQEDTDPITKALVGTHVMTYGAVIRGHYLNITGLPQDMVGGADKISCTVSRGGLHYLTSIWIIGASRG